MKRKRKPNPNIDLIADECLSDSVDRTLVFGPVVSNEQLTKGWYFTVASAGQEGFRVDQFIVGDDRETSIQWRSAIKMGLMINRKPLVVIDTDDELEMARLCEALWPGEKITKLRKAVEAERATW
jgi:hypothetical protein